MHHIASYALSEPECDAISTLLDGVVDTYPAVECEDFLNDVTVLAHELPRGLRAFLVGFRMSAGNQPFAHISGYPISDDRVGETPAHWNERPRPSPTKREEIFFMLCGALIGDAFGWATQQNGYLIHEVLPIKGYEFAEMGFSSEAPLSWHTEDAFHPLRADYVGLMCIRNPTETPTTVGTADTSVLTESELDRLFQPCVTIRPDNSHKPQERVDANTGGARLDEAYDAMVAADETPEPVAVLYGARKSPNLCIDPAFTDISDDDPEARGAVTKLIENIESRMTDVVLRSGDIFFIDNRFATHGRKPFKSKYDGRDRWLKRINITQNLAKSRGSRGGCSNRIIYS